MITKEDAWEITKRVDDYGVEADFLETLVHILADMMEERKIEGGHGDGPVRCS